MRSLCTLWRALPDSVSGRVFMLSALRSLWALWRRWLLGKLHTERLGSSLVTHPIAAAPRTGECCRHNSSPAPNAGKRFEARARVVSTFCPVDSQPWHFGTTARIVGTE